MKILLQNHSFVRAVTVTQLMETLHFKNGTRAFFVMERA